ncbi:MAG: DNA double-strand break repair nuclease NurA [Candidatus Methanomethylicaceae archaeon]
MTINIEHHEQALAQYLQRRSSVAEKVARTLLDNFPYRYGQTVALNAAAALSSMPSPIPTTQVPPIENNQPYAIVGIDSGYVIPTKENPVRYTLIKTYAFAHPLRDQFPEEIIQAIKAVESKTLFTQAEHTLSETAINNIRAIQELNTATKTINILRNAGYTPVVFIDGPLFPVHWVNASSLPDEAYLAIENLLKSLLEHDAIVIAYVDNPAFTTLVQTFRSAFPTTEDEQAILDDLRDSDLLHVLAPPNHVTPPFIPEWRINSWLNHMGFFPTFAYLTLESPRSPNLIFARIECLVPYERLHTFFIDKPVVALTLSQIKLYGDYPFVLTVAHEHASVHRTETQYFDQVIYSIASRYSPTNFPYHPKSRMKMSIFRNHNTIASAWYRRRQ